MQNKNIKSIIQLKRHGARTSNLIGRNEDILLSNKRMGLTCVGYFQFYQHGLEMMNDKLFRSYFDNKKNINIFTSERQRVLDSANALISGINSYSYNNENTNLPKILESNFEENTFNSPKFNHESPFTFIINKFSHIYTHNFTDTISTKNEKLNLFINKNIFNKTISLEDQERLQHKFNLFETENLENYSNPIKPYLEKLFVADIPKGVIDFRNTEILIDSNYFKDNLNLNTIKDLTDFIRCNKLYEDIPIYKNEYKEFINLIKKFLVNFYENSSTFEQSINILRLKTFFKELFKIVEDDSPSFNIFINHNTAIRTFIKFMLDDEEYLKIKNMNNISDRDFYIIVPKFACKYVIEINSDKSMKLLGNDEDITYMVRKEFLDKKENEFIINFYKFKDYLKETYTHFT